MCGVRPPPLLFSGYAPASVVVYGTCVSVLLRLCAAFGSVSYDGPERSIPTASRTSLPSAFRHVRWE